MGKIHLLLLPTLISFSFLCKGQISFSGKIVDAETKQALSGVNIQIKQKNVHTVSTSTGYFSLNISQKSPGDTVRFSLIGYKPFNLPLSKLQPDTGVFISLAKLNTALAPVHVVGKGYKEGKFGIKHRGLIMHFTDGMFAPGDSLEIAQVVDFGSQEVKIKNLKLYILESREDTASFAINFYSYQKGTGGKALLDQPLVKKLPVKKGWLTFDLLPHNIKLAGEVVAAVRFLPEDKEQQPISYEVKLGGTSKSSYRRGPEDPWSTPPHHYCLYVTALLDHTVAIKEDTISTPDFSIKSKYVNDHYQVFIHLPKGYDQRKYIQYPVIYVLDANAYFDHARQTAWTYAENHKEAPSPIIVGVGYDNAQLMDSLRVRDYTFPRASVRDSFASSGGGDLFYKFLSRELIPRIDSLYNTDINDRTIMGHSFGGYFALYAFLQAVDQGGATPVFHNYVAGSPSITYQEQYIVKTLQQRLNGWRFSPKNKLKLYITMGERELDGPGKIMYDTLVKELKKQDALILKSVMYPHADHLGTAVPTIQDAFPFLYPEK